MGPKSGLLAKTIGMVVVAGKAFTKEGLAYAMARINVRYSTIAKMLPRKWGKEGYGLGEPAPEPPRNGDNAKNMGNVVVLDQHPLKAQIEAWQRLNRLTSITPS
jgi:hypothetical protein